MQKITPCLWFDSEAEEAAKFYTDVFSKSPEALREGRTNSKILETVPYIADTPSNKPIGSVMLVNFELNGQPYTALNGGPYFKFNEAISFQVFCKDQKEIDYYWEKLSAVPEAEQCGWVKDKFGVSWQIVPENIGELIKNEKSMQVFLQMKKIDIQALQQVNKG